MAQKKPNPLPTRSAPPAPAVPPRQELMLPEHYLEVGFTEDMKEIIINHGATDAGHLVFSPAQARHLAKLLLRKADECR